MEEQLPTQSGSSPSQIPEVLQILCELPSILSPSLHQTLHLVPGGTGLYGSELWSKHLITPFLGGFGTRQLVVVVLNLHVRLSF